MPGEVANSICSDPVTGISPIQVDSLYNNASYCPSDPNESDNGVIFLPVDTISDMWTGDMFNRQVTDLSRVGDFAAAVLVAHEFGHHIQDELTEQVGVPKPAGSEANPTPGVPSNCIVAFWPEWMALLEQ
jgi:hypothetical protein